MTNMVPALVLSLSRLMLPPTLLLPPLPQLHLPQMPAPTPLTTDHGADTVAGEVADTATVATATVDTVTTHTPTATTHTLATATPTTVTATRPRRSV